MQDCAPPHITRCVNQVLQRHFCEVAIVSRHFPTAWPAISPDLNPCYFWPWAYLKDLAYGYPITSVSHPKYSTARHMHNIRRHTLN